MQASLLLALHSNSPAQLGLEAGCKAGIEVP